MHSLYLTLVGLLFLIQSSYSAPVNQTNIEFVILHNNDMHARFEQISISGGKCTDEQAEGNKCYGGFARIAHLIRKYREEAKTIGVPVIYLNAGDTYTGTPWFSIFRDNITAAFLNVLSPDAISLGNHEFDDGVEGVVPFLNEVNFPVLAANLNLTNTPSLAATKSLMPSTVLEVGEGTKVGIIGYLTPDTKNLVKPNTVEYFPEIESINSEAERLKKDGVNIIIALGHSGYITDQEIAKSCPEVDIVIGGHSHSYLFDGDETPDDQPEIIEGPYPTYVKQDSGKEVPVVQAYAYTKYLGKIHVTFDKAGNLLHFDGVPILLNHEIPRDGDVLELLEVYRPNITALEKAVVGHTKTFLEGSSCRRMECNLGNLLTESMVYSRIKQLENSTYWTDASIAFLQGGGIRNSIDKRPDGNITQNDIINVLPFFNTLKIVQIHGKTIRNALERSAEVYETDASGGFLQMYGVKVHYNMGNDVGERVLNVQVLCAECDIPKYSELNDTAEYKVVVSEFLVGGGDGHVFTEEGSPAPLDMKIIDSNAFTELIRDRQMVYAEVDDRIIISDSKTDSSSAMSSSILTVIVACLLSRFL